MFNVVQKEEYIHSILERSNVVDRNKYNSQLINFFNRIEQVEQEIGKDFANFNYEEIKLALSIICKRTVKYQKSILSQLRQYLTWAIENNKSLDNENRLIGITPKDIDFSISYKMSMVKDEDQLEEYLDIVLNQIGKDTIHNMYRGLLHLIFNGLTFREAIELKNIDLDLKDKKLYLKNREVIMSDQCRDVLEYLSKMSGYATKRDWLDIAETGHVLERTVDNRENMAEALMPYVSNFMSKLKESLNYQISITPNSLFLSGIFYRTYQKELETGNIDFSEYMLSIEYNSATISSPVYTQEEGMEEYLSWKKAFDLH